MNTATMEMMQASVRAAGDKLAQAFGQRPTLDYTHSEQASTVHSRMDILADQIIAKSLLAQWFDRCGEPVLFISEEKAIRLYTDVTASTEDVSPDKVATWQGPCFVVDPLCGSICYARGIRDFCISIAYLYGGQPRASVVLDPSGGELFSAIEGEGAYCNGRRMAPSGTSQLRYALISIEHGVGKRMPCEDVQALNQAILRVRTAATCGLELCYVADGRLDALIKTNQAFYDYVGGSLILHESAGSNALLSLQGNPSVLPLPTVNVRASFIACNTVLGPSIVPFTRRW